MTVAAIFYLYLFMDRIVKIPLKNGCVALIDEDDLKLVSEYTGWYAARYGSRWYVRGYDPRGYIAKGRKQKMVILHRIIMRENDPNILIDHKDHDGLNNCKSNLRRCSQSENQRNRAGTAKHKTSSKYVGVFRRDLKNGGFSWRAGLRISGKWIMLGTFKDEEHAANAYNNAAKQHFGEFASLNKLPSVSVGK